MTHPPVSGSPEEAGITAVTRLRREGETACIRCELFLEDFREAAEDRVTPAPGQTEDRCELRMAQLLYSLFVRLFGYAHDWGIVTGVRPIKLLRRLTQERGAEAADAWFRDQLLVLDNKRELSRETLAHENRVLSLSRPDSFSLYLSIPFCPTRCDYCSFVSQTVVRAAKLIPEYVRLLAQEVAQTGVLARELGLRLETVYFGGGTPTTLTAEQLDTLLRAVEEHFDLSSVREYTVEAGRPDTVTEEKFRVLRRHGVSRISINPQTLNDGVLRNIGRPPYGRAIL